MAVDLQPDIVLMDPVMPGCDGIMATRRIASQAPDVRVVILSVTSDEEAALLALKSGAVGYVSKAIELDALVRVVRGVYRGEAALSRTMTQRLISEFRSLSMGGQHTATRRSRQASSVLSRREQEILELLAAGLTTEAIARTLSLAIETVRTHIKAILRKLRVHSRREAIAVAHRRGMLSPADAAIGDGPAS